MLSLVQVLLLALLDYHRRAAAIHDSQALHRCLRARALPLLVAYHRLRWAAARRLPPPAAALAAPGGLEAHEGRSLLALALAGAARGARGARGNLLESLEGVLRRPRGDMLAQAALAAQVPPPISY